MLSAVMSGFPAPALCAQLTPCRGSIPLQLRCACSRATTAQPPYRRSSSTRARVCCRIFDDLALQPALPGSPNQINCMSGPCHALPLTSSAHSSAAAAFRSSTPPPPAPPAPPASRWRSAVWRSSAAAALQTSSSQNASPRSPLSYPRTRPRSTSLASVSASGALGVPQPHSSIRICLHGHVFCRIAAQRFAACSSLCFVRAL